jgi:hypothetical protein
MCLLLQKQGTLGWLFPGLRVFQLTSFAITAAFSGDHPLPANGSAYPNSTGFRIARSPWLCYSQRRHESRCPKPLLLSPVEPIRRVSPLVFDLSLSIDQKTHPC